MRRYGDAAALITDAVNRYREDVVGHQFPGEQESYRGNALPDTFVPDSYVWTADGGKQPEVVGWSRVRFRNYAFVRVDVRPGFFVSEMDVVAVDEYGRAFDKLTFRRQLRA